MRARNKTTDTGESMESAFRAGTEAWRERIEQASRGFGDFATFNRQNMEAMVKAANLAARGFEQLNSELLTFSRQAMEDGAAAMKSMMSSKSLQEAVQAQSEYTKSAFDAYVGQMTKLQEIISGMARDASEPLNDRMKAIMETMQAQRDAA